MTKAKLAVIVAACLAAPPPVMAANLPQEGDFRATYYLIDEPYKREPFAGGKNAYIGDETVINAGETGGGFFQNMTGRCLFQGIGDASEAHSQGHCTRVDPDGDMIFATFESTRNGAHVVGTSKFDGGTGKYAGITGSSDYTVDPVKMIDKDMRPIAEAHAHGHYRLGAAPGPTNAK